MVNEIDNDLIVDRIKKRITFLTKHDMFPMGGLSSQVAALEWVLSMFEDHKYILNDDDEDIPG